MKMLLKVDDLKSNAQQLYREGRYSDITAMDAIPRLADYIEQAETVRLLLPDDTGIELRK
jgi:hypothetical protein